jgi:FtsP/CotA-like multicopper oxidase with cupredoxin domain
MGESTKKKRLCRLRIRLLVNFGINPGLFLYHCHNLEHGDAGMMRNYYITGNASSTNEKSIT